MHAAGKVRRRMDPIEQVCGNRLEGFPFHILTSFWSSFWIINWVLTSRGMLLLRLVLRSNWACTFFWNWRLTFSFLAVSIWTQTRANGKFHTKRTRWSITVIQLLVLKFRYFPTRIIFFWWSLIWRSYDFFFQVDTLTGEVTVLRTDIVFDCGTSLNPILDMGQVQVWKNDLWIHEPVTSLRDFFFFFFSVLNSILSLGWICSRVRLLPPGRVDLWSHHWASDKVCEGSFSNLSLKTFLISSSSNDTWEYKPPLAFDIPIDFRCHLERNAPNPLGVLGSKARLTILPFAFPFFRFSESPFSGEPPTVLSSVIFWSVQHAILSAKNDPQLVSSLKLKKKEESQSNGKVVSETVFIMDTPASVDAVQLACDVDPAKFSF